MSHNAEFNMLIITCGGLTKDFPMVKSCLPKSSEGSTKSVEVDSSLCVKFNIKSCGDHPSRLKEYCESTDAYIIFYDTTRPETVSIYHSFITNVIRTNGRAVRVVGIQPQSHKRSIKRKSQKSKSISAGWGSYHQIIINKGGDNSAERRQLYSSIGAELIQNLERKKSKKLKQCTIL